MKNAFSNINPNNIMKSLALSKYNNKKKLESIWHFELYRVLCKILPEDVYISPEVGKVFCDNGSIDLYIPPSYCWGIELLVDGVGMKEHFMRFQSGNECFEFYRLFLLY